MIYLYIYLLFSFGSLFEIVTPKKYEKINDLLYKILMIFLIIFFGFRGFISTDWVSYYDSYSKIPTINQSINTIYSVYSSINYEIGFKIYMTIIKTICNNYQFFIFINTLLDIYFLNIIIKRYTKYKITMSLCYLVFSGVFLQVDILRNAKSIMLFGLSLEYLYKKNIKKYFILNILGVLFHRSAIMYLPLYFVLNKKFKKRTISLFILLMNFIYLFNFIQVSKVIPLFYNILPQKISYKLLSYSMHNLYGSQIGLEFGFVIKMIFTIMIIINYKKITENRFNIIVINLFFIHTSIYLFSRNFYLIRDRVLTNYIISYWYIFIVFLELYNKKIIKVFLMFIFLIYFFKILVINQIKYSYNLRNKYYNILFEYHSYEDRLKFIEVDF